jgi:hypothetical protein
MLKPSRINDFLGAWTYSVAVSHANLFPQQELEKALKTLAISTPTSVEESESANLELFSSKTLKESSQAKPKTESQFSSMSSATWKEWVTEQRQEYSQRAKLAHLTRESESLSWATPNTMDTLPARSPEKLAEAKKKGGCKNLREEVMNYPTPRTADAEGGRIETFVEDGTFKSKRHKSNQTFGAKLRDAVESWPTPTTAEGTKIGNQANYGQKGLSNHPEIVGKPTRKKGVKSYPTPTARDWKGTYKTIIRKDGKSRMDNLPQVADSLQDPTSHSMDGKNHVLNPSWVEQLMGLQVEWTDLGSWVTESSQTQQQ